MMFIIWGSLLAPTIYPDRLLLALLAAVAYLMGASYSIDLLRGNHIGQTHFSRRHLKARAALGLAVASIIGLYIFITVSWWLLVLWGVGVVGIVGYNYEVLGAAKGRRLIFCLVWGFFPVVAHYWLMGFTMPPPALWVLAAAAALFAELHIISYGLWSCRLPENFCCISEGKKDCHGMDPAVRRAIPKEIHKAAKRQSNLQVAFLVLVTAALATWRLV